MDPVSPYFRLQRSAGFSLLNVKRILSSRSRAKVLNRNDSGQALRDDKVAKFRAKISQSAEAGQSPSVASLCSAKASSDFVGLKKYTENDRPLKDNVVFTAISGFLFFSAERFLEHDAETSMTERAGYRV